VSRPGLNQVELRRHLTTQSDRLWTELHVLEITGSTNLDVSAAAAAGAAEGLVVAAEAQHAGRGRHGREWVSPPRAGLTFSVLLRPTVPRRCWGWLPLLAGLALRNAVTRRWPIAASLKWPNDLLLGQPPRKSAGILAAMVPGPAPAVVLGMGLNITNGADELPRTDATSVSLVTGQVPDRDELLMSVLSELRSLYRRWQAAGGDVESTGIRDQYRGCCDTLGRQVRAPLPTSEVLGEAVDIDADGQLLLATSDGMVKLAAADVTSVRRSTA
jgi:BirA family biotin operon repressor/biotin-[acetyl-CoA-carboxylase] ligase